MAYTTTVTRATGYVVLASVWNNEHVNNMAYLHGDGGGVDVSGGGAQFNFNAVGTGAGPVQNSRAFQGLVAFGSVLQTVGSVASTSTLATAVQGDSAWRLIVQADGTLAWSGDTTLARSGAGQLTATGNLLVSGYPAGGESHVSQAAGTTWTPALSSGVVQRCNVTSTGTLTVGSPGAVASGFGGILILIIHNASGGVVTYSWNAVYTPAPANTGPANGSGHLLLLAWNPATSKWQVVVGPISE